MAIIFFACPLISNVSLSAVGHFKLKYFRGLYYVCDRDFINPVRNCLHNPITSSCYIMAVIDYRFHLPFPDIDTGTETNNAALFDLVMAVHSTDLH